MVSFATVTTRTQLRPKRLAAQSLFSGAQKYQHHALLGCLAAAARASRAAARPASLPLTTLPAHAAACPLPAPHANGSALRKQSSKSSTVSASCAPRSCVDERSMGRAPNRRDLGPAPGPVPSDGGAGKVQSRKPPAPPHGKKPLMEPIQSIADKVTGIGTLRAWNRWDAGILRLQHAPTCTAAPPPPPSADVPRLSFWVVFFGSSLHA